MSRYLTDGEVAFVMECRSMGIPNKVIARALGKDPERMERSTRWARDKGMSDQSPRFTKRGRAR